MRKYLLIPCLLILFFSIASANDAARDSSPYDPLIRRLLQDGFDPEFLSGLLADPRAELIPRVMTLSLSFGESPELYAKFLTPELISLSKKFLRDHLAILKNMENRFHVDKEIVVAILLVESRFGENIGRYRVIPTLASMAVMDSEENLWRNFMILSQINPDLCYQWLQGRAKRRANWAYSELKSFMKIVQNEKIDPLDVRGSFAGALGMAQFVPSSYLAYALKEKGLENWLLSKEEAILSIGNYLKSNGWKKNISFDQKKKVLWSYNQSTPYVETILEVARRIRPSTPPK